MPKTPNPNNKPPRRKRTATTGPRCSYQDVLSWKDYKIGPMDIPKLCQELHEWVHTDESWDMLQFYNMKGIGRRTFEDWLPKHSNLKDMYEYAKSVLAEKRQRYATFRRYGTDPMVIQRTLHQYHPDWKLVYDEDRELKLKKLELQDKESKATQQAMAFFGLGMKKNETDIPG